MTIKSEANRINALNKAIEKLSDEGDKRFAQSLVSQFDRKQALSPRQWYFVDRFIDPPKTVDVEVPNLAPIVERLAKAGANKAFPFFTIPVGNDTTVRLSLAGKRARWPGSVQVQVHPNADDKDRTWIGRIRPDGQWDCARTFKGMPEEVHVIAAIANYLESKPAAKRTRRRRAAK